MSHAGGPTRGEEVVLVRRERGAPEHHHHHVVHRPHRHEHRPPPSPSDVVRDEGRLVPISGRRESLRGPLKRLIVACDGTWMNSDSGLRNGKIQTESNVTRMCRAIRPESEDGIQQIVYYHKGIATQGGVVDRVMMGAIGEGLDEHVREAYSFISNNYAPGDEIYLFGYSRGAYTVRAVAGLIAVVGILTKRGLEDLQVIFHDVLHRRTEGYRPRYPDIPFPNKPSANNPRYREELYRRHLTYLDVPIKAIGVWDTVGSLGLPRIGMLTRMGIQRDESREMAFYDTKLSDCIENAFQALALDEQRASFSPALWEKPEGNRTCLRQVWFPGAHGNIGGGYDEQSLANISLAWMLAQFSPMLDLYRDYIVHCHDEATAWFRRHHERPRPWSFGRIKGTNTGIFALGGGTPRTPGDYCAVDPDSGRETRRPLRRTCEYIHPSVRVRWRRDGPGEEDRGEYDPEGLLEGWRLVVEYPRGENERPDVVWVRKRGNPPGGPEAPEVLPESPLWDVERRLLALDPEMEDMVRWPRETRRRDHRRSVAGPSLPPA